MFRSNRRVFDTDHIPHSLTCTSRQVAFESLRFVPSGYQSRSYAKLAGIRAVEGSTDRVTDMSPSGIALPPSQSLSNLQDRADLSGACELLKHVRSEQLPLSTGLNMRQDRSPSCSDPLTPYPHQYTFPSPSTSSCSPLRWSSANNLTAGKATRRSSMIQRVCRLKVKHFRQG